MANVTFVKSELGGGKALDEEVLGTMRGALADADEGAKRMRDIIRDLETFSRESDSELGPLEVEPVVESAIKMCANELRYRAQFERDYTPVPPAWGRQTRLGQIILNLLVNAIHATPSDDPQALRITLRTRRREPSQVIIEVADTGVGIPPEHLAKIFDPFFTTRPVGKGRGLGLSICHNLAKAMGGDIEVESTLGVGSTFRVVLKEASAQPLAS
jgi:signal transduction histidine kinase